MRFETKGRYLWGLEEKEWVDVGWWVWVDMGGWVWVDMGEIRDEREDLWGLEGKVAGKEWVDVG